MASATSISEFGTQLIHNKPHLENRYDYNVFYDRCQRCTMCERWIPSCASVDARPTTYIRDVRHSTDERIAQLH